MLFSVATGYALRALADLPEDGRFRLSKDLADTLGLPGPYLSKILQTLVKKGLLDSVRGPGGGFRLALPAHRITVGAVVRIMEGQGRTGCAMGLATCKGSGAPCPLHEVWSQLQAQLEWTLAMVTIRDLQPWNRVRHPGKRPTLGPCPPRPSKPAAGPRETGSSRPGSKSAIPP